MLKRNWLAISTGAVLALLGLCAFETLRPRHWVFESEAAYAAVAQALPANLSKWQAHNIRDYDVDARMSFPPGCVMGQDTVTIHVRGGHVATLDWHTSLPPEGVDAFYKQFCNAERVVPDGSLNLNGALSSINAAEEYVSADFDPEYGFIRKWTYEANSTSIGDSTGWYELSNFKPVTK